MRLATGEIEMDMGRFLEGFRWGLMATLVMSALMLIGVASGMSPMPQPIPVAIMSALLGASTPKPLLMALGVLSHLAYGGFWGGTLAVLTKPVTISKGIGLGVGLWLLMQVVVLPFVGWGVFGSGISPKIAVATLVLHLVYGASYGALMVRRAAAPPAGAGL